jgi:mono/diheme cytochrome c family protein
MVGALSTGHEIGLAIAGACFIVFALLCSFYFPTKNPNFPGERGLQWFLPVSVALFMCMLGAVLYFGQEKRLSQNEAQAATNPPSTTTTSSSAPSGNPTAGKAVFMSAGCNACHTFTPAGASGKVGPDLDHLADYASKAGEPLPSYVEGAITHPPPKYVPPGFPTNAMPTTFGKSLSQQQINDLVAFLTQTQ